MNLIHSRPNSSPFYRVSFYATFLLTFSRFCSANEQLDGYVHRKRSYFVGLVLRPDSESG